MTLSARRARWIAMLTVFLLCICGIRLFQLQVVSAPTLAAEGEAVRTAENQLPARRGSITDVNGTILADSVQTYHIAVNQQAISQWVNYRRDESGRLTDIVEGRGPVEAARLLAPYLEMEAAELGGMMLGDSTYQYLKKNVDAASYREIRKLGIHGIEWEPVHERIYPNGNTAAPILGSVNAESVGSAGIEAVMDQVLQGTPGREAYEIAPNGAVMPQGKQIIEEPRDGGSVHLTIHADLQHLIQEKLDQRVKQHEARWGSVVVLEVSSGRILAMADSLSQEPSPSLVQPVAAVQYAVEPGSVGKVITLAAALDLGRITPTTVFDVPDSIDLPDAGGPIRDISEHPPIQLTSTGILAQSSNVGTVKIGQTLTKEELHDYFVKFGLGQLTGVELPGEAAGVIQDAETWQGRDVYVKMFGQSYSMSPLQEASVMATIGNGGVRVDPRIIDSWQNSDGTVEYSKAPEPVQVLSVEASKEITRMMEAVVADEMGTGSQGALDGYRVALKTGTAEFFEDGRSGVISTAAGLVPADKPRLAIAVVLFDPKVGFYGGQSSAPLLGDTAADAVRTLGIPASTEPLELYPVTP